MSWTFRAPGWGRVLVVLALLLASPRSAVAQEGKDFGERQEEALRAQTPELFGFDRPLDAPSAMAIDRALGQPATDRQRLAVGLTPKLVARNVASRADMIAFWPDDLSYTHLIVCIEQARSPATVSLPEGGLNASVQRVAVTPGAAFGTVETILHGMSHCDGLRTTPWGTILATEEIRDGGAYEILDPLTTTGHWVARRGLPGEAADIRTGLGSLEASRNVVKRTALATQAWEGLAVLDNGVVLGGDELRPGTGPAGFDSDGGAIYRFVPDAFYDCQGAPVRPGQLCDNTLDDLAASPLVSGRTFALAHGCAATRHVGQGCETGLGRWVEVEPSTARANAHARGATGYCRPEDLHVERSFGELAGGQGIRWCWANTCGGGLGEVLCAEENGMDDAATVFDPSFGGNLLSPDGAAPTLTVTSRFVDGDARMNALDNLDMQPGTRNVYITEDAAFGEVFACLPDGRDRDFRTDGCVSMLSVNSTVAEPTGFVFDGTGRVAYYIVQHGQQPAELLDFISNPVDGTTDDLIRITGFEVPESPLRGLGRRLPQP